MGTKKSLDEFGPHSTLVSFDFTSPLILVTRALLQVCGSCYIYYMI